LLSHNSELIGISLIGLPLGVGGGGGGGEGGSGGFISLRVLP